MTDSPLDEKVVLLVEALEEANIPYAFGGAIALAYYAEPRGTVDIDVNVLVSTDAVGDVLAVMYGLGARLDSEAHAQARRDGQLRVRWGITPVDLFFSHDPFHDEVAKRVRAVPFAGREITILGAEDLVVFKTCFGRRKDWIDVEQVAFTMAGSFDAGYVLRWTERLLGLGDHRYAEVSAILERFLGPSVESPRAEGD